jgi:hypothetical protein
VQPPGSGATKLALPRTHVIEFSSHPTQLVATVGNHNVGGFFRAVPSLAHGGIYARVAAGAELRAPSLAGQTRHSRRAVRGSMYLLVGHKTCQSNTYSRGRQRRRKLTVRWSSPAGMCGPTHPGAHGPLTALAKKHLPASTTSRSRKKPSVSMRKRVSQLREPVARSVDHSPTRVTHALTTTTTPTLLSS